MEHLINENNMLRETITKLRDHFGYEICEFFQNCNSLEETTKTFYFENIRQCYLTLVNFYDGYDIVNQAVDYEKYKNEL